MLEVYPFWGYAVITIGGLAVELFLNGDVRHGWGPFMDRT